MAIHLLLLAINTVSPGLAGYVKICLDCIGALGCIAELPPYRIPTRCRHLDILKTILVNCGGLSTIGNIFMSKHMKTTACSGRIYPLN
jgi:hypothetical protein